MIVSGGFEALFGLSALVAPGLLIAALGTEANTACLILWTATELGGAALWSTGVIHAAIGALLVLALLRRRRA